MSPIFITNILCGPMVIITGYIMLKVPPTKINGFYGYRTLSSMKNQENWDFAQKFSSKELMKWGAIMTLLSFIGLVVRFEAPYEDIIALTICLGACFIPIIRTQRAIKKLAK